jgi:hypothetical protein
MNKRPPLPDERESRAAVALTVVWMLACMSTVVGMAVVGLLHLGMAVTPVAAGGLHPLARISGVMLFVAIVTGVLSLVLTPLAYRVRMVPPPRAITIAAVLIGLLPLVVLVVLALFPAR